MHILRHSEILVAVLEAGRGEDIGLYTILVPKVLYASSLSLVGLKTLGTFIKSYFTGWFVLRTRRVQTLQPMILINRRSSFVFHHWKY